MPITPSPAVLRACDVLEHLAARPGEASSVSELSRAVGIPRATCDAILLALADRGFVDRRDPDLRYTLGAACVGLGDAARTGGALLARVAPVADALGRATGTCVALASSDGVQTRVERVFDHAPAIGVRTRAGEAVPLGAPFGAVFVAWDDDPVIEQWLDRAGAPLDASERRRYRAALEAVRTRGYSVAVANVRPDLLGILERLVEQPTSRRAIRERDAALREISRSNYLPVDLDAEAPRRVNQMSAPVFDRAGRVVLAIMLLGPNFDLTAAEMDALAGRLLVAAAEATEQIGGLTAVPYRAVGAAS